MIGLEYILKLYNVQQNELADELGIRRQNINIWLSGKQDVSKKHLPALSKKFHIPEEYFQKEINETDMQKINEYKEYSKTRIGMTGLSYLNRKYSKNVIKLINQLEVAKETFFKWEKETESIPNDKLKQISNFYNVKEEYIQKDLYHDDYVKLVEITFKNEMKSKMLNKEYHCNIVISDDKIELLRAKLNEFNGRKIYTLFTTVGMEAGNILNYFTSYIFEESNEKLFFMKDKFSINSYTGLLSDVEDINFDRNDEDKITLIIRHNCKIVISTDKQIMERERLY